MSKRKKPSVRKKEILAAAMELAKTDHYIRVTRERIAERVNISTGLVNLYFNTMNELRSAIVRNAINEEVIEVVAQAIANKDPQALDISHELKCQAAAHLMDN